MTDLRAIAEAATPGPWVPQSRDDGRSEPWYLDTHAYPDGPEPVWAPPQYPVREADAAHIAAWSPDRALAALDVIEAAETLADCRLCSEATGTLCRRHRVDIAAALARWNALP